MNNDAAERVYYRKIGKKVKRLNNTKSRATLHGVVFFTVLFSLSYLLSLAL